MVKKLVAFALFTGIGIAGWMMFRAVMVEQKTSLYIAPGTTITVMADTLEAKGLIHSPTAFRWYVKLHGLTPDLQAGSFTVPAGELSLGGLTTLLQKAESKDIRLTFLEGWNSSDMDAYLTETVPGFKAGSFKAAALAGNPGHTGMLTRPVVSLEGYLFPDTYFVNPVTTDAGDIVALMEQTMQKKLKEAGYDPQVHTRPLHDYLTMASIIELEERSNVNMPKVADILWRRLDAKWQIGADATLFYVTGHKSLTSDDLALDSPYNTRKNRGLPPTPVCSPGLAALKAALFPEKNQYWYYLHGTDGAIHYAVDGTGHEENKRKYL